MNENKPGVKRTRKMDNNLNLGKENSNRGSKENEDRFRKLAENMPVLINAVTKDANFTFWNQRCEEVTGYSSEEIVGNPEAMSLLYPDDPYRDQLAIQWQESGLLFNQKQVTLSAKDGSLRYILWTNLPREISFSQVDIWAVGLDITDSKITELALQEEQAFLQVILNLTTEFINIPLDEYDSKINEMLGRIGEYIRMDRIYVNRHDYSRQVTSETHEWCAEGIPSQIINSQDTPFAFFTDLLALMQKGEIVHIPSVVSMSEDHIMRPIFEQQGAQSLVAIPIFHENINTGFVGFSAVKSIRTFTEKEKALLKVLAEIISNAFSRKQIEETITEKNEILAILNRCSIQQAEAQTYDGLIEVIAEQLKQHTDLVGFSFSDYIYDKKVLALRKIRADQKIIDMGIRLGGEKILKTEIPVDEEFYKEITADIVGYRSTLTEATAGVIPEYISSAIQALSGVTCIVGLAHVIEGRLYGVTTFGLKKKQTKFSDDFLKSYAYLTAISLRRLQAEEALRKGEKRLRQIIDLVPHFIFAKDVGGQFILVNKAVADVYGTTVDQLTGMTDADFAQSEEEVRHFRKHDLAVIETGVPGYIPEESITDSKGNIRFLSTTKIPFISDNNNRAILGVSVDITDRRRAEEALIESESKYREILETIEDGYYEADLKGNIISCNNSLCTMFGYSKDELNGLNYKKLYKNPNLVFATYNRVYRTGIPEKAAGWLIETKDKRNIYVELSITLCRDYQNNPIGFRGVARDISERKKAEEALRFRYEFEKMVSEISSRFVNLPLEDIDAGIYDTLRTIGEFFNVDRSYVYKFSDDGRFYSNTHLWCAPGVKTYFEKDQNIPADHPPSLWLSELLSARPVIIDDIDKMPAEAKDDQLDFQYEEIQSLLSLPLTWEGKSIGCIGYDLVKDKQAWPQHVIVLTQVIAELITGALMRQKNDLKIRFISLHDQLTGLYNRSFLEEELSRMDTVRQLPLTIIMADLNGLKMINDTYGHATGDEVLNKAASVLRSCCREEDIIARWGGDEFVILLPSTSVKTAEEIRKRIAAKCQDTQVKSLPLSIALGMASKTKDEQDLRKVLHEAEDDMYKQKLAESRSARSTVVNAFLKTLAEKSSETEVHTKRMKDVALVIGKKIMLPNSELSRLELLVTLHDIGKINISEEILSKKDKLSPEEWGIMKRHSEMGYRITRATEDFAHVANDILAHHEHWDGTGYPHGLKGEEIPLLARITAIADAYEVMTNGRPYREPLSRDEVLAELKSCAATCFDPELIKIFLEILAED